MQQPLCKSCCYYLQHYAIGERKIYRVYCGHCTVARPKRKLPDAKCCDLYVPGTRDEEHFVSKEYLSKALLQYVLELELLPLLDTDGTVME